MSNMIKLLFQSLIIKSLNLFFCHNIFVAQITSKDNFSDTLIKSNIVQIIKSMKLKVE